MKMSYDEIIRNLKKWGYNHGEIEEIVARLASNSGRYITFADAEVDKKNNIIYYSLSLTPQGVRLYQKWCEKNGYSFMLRDNVLKFTDEDRESVLNTIAELNETVQP